MRNVTSKPMLLCIALLCLAGITTLGCTEQPAKEELHANKPKLSVEEFLEQNVQEAPYRQNLASSNDEIQTFNPEDFVLSDLVKNLDAGNYFKMPAKAKAFLRQVLDSNVDFKFKPTNEKGRYAYIDSDLKSTIWINHSNPPARLGEAICHELLHFQDFQEFKPVTVFNFPKAMKDQLRVFGQQLGTLVNIISHEFVIRELQDLGFAEPRVPAMRNSLKTMDGRLAHFEDTFETLSAQLAGQPGKTAQANIPNLQSAYQEMMMIVLRDKLLFGGSYTEEVDALLARFEHVMEFIKAGTQEDPRFKSVYREIRANAQEVRKVTDRYHSSGKTTTDRYAMIPETLNSMYSELGFSFSLVTRNEGPPALGIKSSVFKGGESFLLDGQFLFSNVKPFKRHEQDTRAPVAPTAELGDEAPALNIQEWVEGDPVNLAEAKGKHILVVEFWATWCRPCLASIPHLSAIQKKFKDKNVVMIGVSREDASKVKPFVERQGDEMDYRVAIDKDGKTSDDYLRAFGARGIPHAFIVNKQGRIVWHGHPMQPDLVGTIEKLLSGTN